MLANGLLFFSTTGLTGAGGGGDTGLGVILCGVSFFGCGSGISSLFCEVEASLNIFASSVSCWLPAVNPDSVDFSVPVL